MKNFIMIIISFLITSFASAETVQVPLTYLLPEGREPVLRGQWDKLTFPLTILDNQQADSVSVSLMLKHSKNIDTTTVWLNLGDKPLANIRIYPNNKPQQIVANLTPELLTKYGNQLTLSVHHLLSGSLSVTQQRIEASEAATEIVADQSFYELTYTENTSLPTLESFTQLMKSGQGYQHDIELESFLLKDSDTSLSVASLLVQGWTLRSGSEKYHFSYHHAENHLTAKHQQSNVRLVYGTQSQLAAESILPADYLNAIQGPYLALYKPVGHNNWVFVVSGRTENELAMAAQHFATPNYKLPKQPFTLVSSHQPKSRNSLASDQRYQLNMLTQQQQFGDEPLMLPLMMPANFLVNKEEGAQLNLLLTHPKVSPGDAAMVLRINGEYANSMPLRSSYWRSTQHYRLTFPMERLHPGLNTISIELYGPELPNHLDQGPAYHPFTASLSSQSTISLGSWISYIPAGTQQISADGLLVIAANHGNKAQLTLNYEQASNLSEVWQLISYISHNSRQAMLDLLLTTNDTQTRPINLIFTTGEQAPASPPSNKAAEKGGLSQIRQYLLSMMSNSSSPLPGKQTASSPSEYFQYGNNQLFRTNNRTDTSFGVISSKPGEGKSRIEFYATDSNQLTANMENYLNQRTTYGKSAIRQAVPHYKDDIQLARAGFINIPYSLPLLLLCLIFPLGLLIQRALGDKS